MQLISHLKEERTKQMEEKLLKKSVEAEARKVGDPLPVRDQMESARLNKERSERQAQISKEYREALQRQVDQRKENKSVNDREAKKLLAAEMIAEQEVKGQLEIMAKEKVAALQSTYGEKTAEKVKRTLASKNIL
eukprot:Filipodium_phascolosomae@DN6842_c0_g1_i1.p1